MNCQMLVHIFSKLPRITNVVINLSLRLKAYKVREHRAVGYDTSNKCRDL